MLGSSRGEPMAVVLVLLVAALPMALPAVLVVPLMGDWGTTLPGWLMPKAWGVGVLVLRLSFALLPG